MKQPQVLAADHAVLDQCLEVDHLVPELGAQSLGQGGIGADTSDWLSLTQFDCATMASLP